jgi:adenylosuccinate lyase
MKYVLSGLEVNVRKMRRNLDTLGGYLLSERAMFLIADKLGKQTAHEVVYEASMKGLTKGQTFEEALLEIAAVRDAISIEELRAALDPTTYVGLAPQIVDRVLSAERARGWL